jgi:imidazolonepropionase-like amidohydrolase
MPERETETIALRGALVCDGSAPPAPATLLLRGGSIAEVLQREQPLPSPSREADLEGLVLVPGLIDVHTHLLLGGGGFDDYDRELLRDSLPLRALRAAAHARLAVDHGFLTVRDVCTEGAGYADVALRDAISAGLCEGPRVVPSGPGIGITGGYVPQGFAPGTCVPSGCAIADSPEAGRREVRSQVLHGVEWIKVFADWPYPHPVSHEQRVFPTFTRPELEAIVDEARRRGRKVAAHATSDAGARQAIECGAASLEHMGDLSRETLDAAAEAGVVLVPTLSIVAAMAENPPADRSDRIRGRLDLTAAAFARALASGVRIACGTDIGCYPHARGSLSELRLMMELGMAPLVALRAATGEAADLLDLPERGRIAPGAAADLCAFDCRAEAISPPR